MCYLEYNWTAYVWKFRINDHFTDFRGERSWETIDEARDYLAMFGCSVRRINKTLWLVECDGELP